MHTSTTSSETRAVARPPLPIEKRSVAREILPISTPGKAHERFSDESATSAGSRSVVSSVGSDEWNLTSPVNWRIRNTFLDSPFVKPTLYQGFQTSRRAWSVPAAGREAAEREEISEMSPVHGEMAEDIFAPVQPVALPQTEAPEPPAPRPLALAELVVPQSHSKGSALHFQGTCKPCAFFWKLVGCQYGSECEFCHLCDADERKRRNKEKRMAMHAIQTSSKGMHAAPSVPRHSRGNRMGGQRFPSIP